MLIITYMYSWLYSRLQATDQAHNSRRSVARTLNGNTQKRVVINKHGDFCWTRKIKQNFGNVSKWVTSQNEQKLPGISIRDHFLPNIGLALSNCERWFLGSILQRSSLTRDYEQQIRLDHDNSRWSVARTLNAPKHGVINMAIFAELGKLNDWECEIIKMAIFCWTRKINDWKCV